MFAAADNSSACSAAPGGNGTAAAAPDTQLEGPTFYRSAAPAYALSQPHHGTLCVHPAILLAAQSPLNSGDYGASDVWTGRDWQHAGACAHMAGCTCRGYMSISSSVQPDAKGHYPDTYLNIGGGKWSKGVAFINGFNLVQPSLPSDPHLGQARCSDARHPTYPGLRGELELHVGVLQGAHMPMHAAHRPLAASAGRLPEPYLDTGHGCGAQFGTGLSGLSAVVHPPNDLQFSKPERRACDLRRAGTGRSWARPTRCTCPGRC